MIIYDDVRFGSAQRKVAGFIYNDLFKMEWHEVRWAEPKRKISVLHFIGDKIFAP